MSTEWALQVGPNKEECLQISNHKFTSTTTTSWAMESHFYALCGPKDLVEREFKKESSELKKVHLEMKLKYRTCSRASQEFEALYLGSDISQARSLWKKICDVFAESKQLHKCIFYAGNDAHKECPEKCSRMKECECKIVFVDQTAAHTRMKTCWINADKNEAFFRGEKGGDMLLILLEIVLNFCLFLHRQTAGARCKWLSCSSVVSFGWAWKEKRYCIWLGGEFLTRYGWSTNRQCNLELDPTHTSDIGSTERR